MKAEYIQHVGSDLTTVNAARVSFDKESDWDLISDEDEHVLSTSDVKLVKYLARHNHFTPFTHCFVTLRETVPIFVARQRFKHTVGFSYNEESRRYIDDTPEFWFPTEWRQRPEGSIKQGSGGVHPESAHISRAVQQLYGWAEGTYNDLIADGVAPEQARAVLPQGCYTSYYVSGSLSAWSRAYLLRSDSHAQLEIRELAQKWNSIIRPLFPVSWDALVGTSSSVDQTASGVNEPKSY